MAVTKKNNRGAKRQRDVARLRSEGRPSGPPRMGYRHCGARGRRYIVADREAREIAAKIVKWRDGQGLSWTRISDEVDRHLARKTRPSADEPIPAPELDLSHMPPPLPSPEGACPSRPLLGNTPQVFGLQPIPADRRVRQTWPVLPPDLPSMPRAPRIRGNGGEEAP